MKEHPVDQKIMLAQITEGQEPWMVGYSLVTRIEACTKSGMYADIPYIRIWAGDCCLAEYCQHNIIGVQFADHEKEAVP